MNGRPRLLILASTYPRWAGDHEPGFVHELGKRLTDAFDVSVLCPHAPGASRWENMDGVEVSRYRYAPEQWETLVNDGGIVTNLRNRPLKWLLVPALLIASTYSLWRKVRSERPDLIHAHWLLPQGLLVALLGLVDSRVPPFLVTSHGADLFALRAGPLLALKRFVARRAAGITVVSRAMKDELIRIGVAGSRIDIEPMGVDLAGRFTTDPGVTRSQDELLFVGRLVEKKGLRYLIEAMPAIIERWPGAALTVVGHGPEYDQHRSRVAALGLKDRIRFVGPVRQAELPALYRRAALFVAPFAPAASGDQEGLGLVLAEAVGCGCPLVVGDVPAVRDITDRTEISTRVAIADIAALAEAVLANLELPPSAEQLRRSRQAVVDRFDWNCRAEAYRLLLSSIIDGRRSGAGTADADASAPGRTP